MAKWGEGKIIENPWKLSRPKFFHLFFSKLLGDPRWIVEERPDATNVNNWHWKESNATGWSKDKLNELFLLFEISDGNNLSCKIVEFDRLSGEATANNRKAKLIFFYEWDLVLKWQGQILNDESNTKINGKITIPNLSEENELDEIDIQVTVDDSNDKSEVLKQFMYNIGRTKIREKLGMYITSLKNDYAKNLILPKKDDSQVRKDPVLHPELTHLTFWLHLIRPRTKLPQRLITLPLTRLLSTIQSRQVPQIQTASLWALRSIARR